VFDECSQLKQQRTDSSPEYKDVLKNVCNMEMFGFKQAVFPETAS
jgi:hypothetical protein